MLDVSALSLLLNSYKITLLATNYRRSLSLSKARYIIYFGIRIDHNSSTQTHPSSYFHTALTFRMDLLHWPHQWEAHPSCSIEERGNAEVWIIRVLNATTKLIHYIPFGHGIFWTLWSFEQEYLKTPTSKQNVDTLTCNTSAVVILF